MFWQKAKEGWQYIKLFFAVNRLKSALQKGTISMEMTLGIIRALLAAGGGLLVNKGWADDGTVESVTGAILVIVAGVWSTINKVQTKKQIESARKEVPPATVEA